jgi:hypothetical protein
MNNATFRSYPGILGHYTLYLVINTYERIRTNHRPHRSTHYPGSFAQASAFKKRGQLICQTQQASELCHPLRVAHYGMPPHFYKKLMATLMISRAPNSRLYCPLNQCAYMEICCCRGTGKSLCLGLFLGINMRKPSHFRDCPHFFIVDSISIAFLKSNFPFVITLDQPCHRRPSPWRC